MAIWQLRMLLRCTSVGWAVSTGTRGGVEEGRQFGAAHAGVEGALQGVGQAAFLWRRAGDLVGAGAADVVLVLGDVREVREVAEGAHHVDGLVAGQGIEGGLQLAAGGAVLVAAKADRALADGLDQVEHRLALLGAHGVAEHAAEQADVVAEGKVFVVAGLLFAHRLLSCRLRSARGKAHQGPMLESRPECRHWCLP
jgi:hypothetical protein